MVLGSTKVKLLRQAANFTPIAIAVLFSHLCGSTPVMSNSSRQVSARDSNDSCYDKDSGKLAGPDKRRTVVLESPDGKYRAYAETEAVAHKRKAAEGDEDVECENKSGLFVAGPQNRQFRQVMSVLPRSDLSGNSIILVDWSRQGHELLIGEGVWAYGSDFGGTEIRIYDADSGTLSSESFVEEAFRKYAGKECIGVYQPKGFSEDGGIVVKAGPYFEEGEEQPRSESCMAKEGNWLIGPAHNAIRQLPDDYIPKHHGKEVPVNLLHK
jgi:hypothetical protein